MFTDIVGYTALMQQSEQSAIKTRRRHRQIFESVTEKYGGIIVQYYGDGTLSIFESSVSAVQCGIELQRQFQSEPLIPVRIGLHTGDIIINETDIIGDSVNLASRVESLGVAGSVLVSGKVAEDIKNHPDLPLVSMGKYHFKNDASQREIFAIKLPGLVIPQKKDLHGKLQPQGPWYHHKSILVGLLAITMVLFSLFAWKAFTADRTPEIEKIGVLPFQNRINDPEQDQIIDGVHEALISKLQQAGIKVKARTSMMRFRNTQKTPTEIADELKVDALVEGSVLRADDSIEINIILVNGATEDVMWTRSFESGFQDLSRLYGEVIRGIADEVHFALSNQVENRFKENKAENPEALKAYLKGQQNYNTLTKKGLETALKYFELALHADPEYAPAYAGIAGVWGARQQRGFVSPAEAIPYISRSISKALELGNDLPEVQFWNAMANTWALWDWEATDEAFQRSLELNPYNAEANAHYALFLHIQGRSEEARPYMELALDTDPFNPMLKAIHGLTMHYEKRYDEVIETLTQTIEKFPNDPFPLSTLRTTYHLAGRYEDALDIWEKFYMVRNDSLGLTIVRKNRDIGYGHTLRLLAEMMVERSNTSYVTPWQIATLYTRAGENAAALDWLEKAFLAHDPNMPFLAVDPIFDNLRDEPRFLIILRKLNLLHTQKGASNSGSITAAK